MRLLFRIYICLLIHSIISKIEYNQLKSGENEEKEEDTWLELGEEFTMDAIIVGKSYEEYYKAKGKKYKLEIKIPALEHKIEAGFCSFSQNIESALFECLSKAKDLVLEEKIEEDKYIITSNFEFEKDDKYFCIFLTIKKEINYLTLKIEENGISGLLIAIIILGIILLILAIIFVAFKYRAKNNKKIDN